MAQIIKHRRGLIGGVKNLTARNGELIIASGSISDLSGPFVFIGSPNAVDEGVAGAFNSVSKLYTGTAAPTITAATYGSALDGTPFYASSNKSLYILNNSNVGNTQIDLTGNIEGNTISGVTINNLTGSRASFDTYVSASALTVTGNTLMNGTLTVNGAATVNNNLTVTGTTNLNGATNVTGTTTLYGQAIVNNNLTVTGTTNLNGATNVTGTTTLYGQAIVNNNLTVTGTTNLNGATNVTGTTTLYGQAIVNNNLTVTGTTNLNSDVNITGTTTIYNNLTVTGNTNIGGDLTITGNTYQTGSIYTQGNIVLSGSINIGDFTGDTINFGGEVSSSILPAVNNAFDLGGPNSAWNDLYVSGTAYIENINLSSISVSSIALPGNLTVSGTTRFSGSVGISGYTTNDVIFVGADGTLIEDTDFTYNPGTGYLSAPIINATTNGVGTNFLVGDDMWIGDVNQADTMIFMGYEDANNAKVILGDYSVNNYLSAISGDTTLSTDETLYLQSVTGDIQLNGTSIRANNTIYGDGDLYIGGNGKVTGSFEVVGATTLNSTLDVTGSATLKSTLEVKGATGLNSTLDVTGSTVLKDTLEVKGATGLNSTLDVTGSATLKSTLEVKGATGLDSTLDVTGSATLKDTLQVKGATGLNSTLDVTGSATLKDTLQVKGATGLNSTLDVTGSATLKSTLEVGTTTELKGAVGMNSTLDVTGSAQFKSTINVDGIATVSSSIVEDLTQYRVVGVGSGGALIDYSGLTYDGTTLKIGGGEFEVDNADGDIRTSGSLTTHGLTNNGDLTVNGILTVTGNTQLQANLYVSGNLEVLGSSTNVNIQSQTVDIGDNIIQVNAYSPFDRYAGLAAYDSGSSGMSGSVLWDSTNDYWLIVNSNTYTSKIIGTTASTGSTGTEISLTSGTFPIATASNTIGDSLLTYTGTTLAYNTNKFTVDSGTGATAISGNLTLSAAGGSDAGTKTSAVTFRNSSNVIGFVSTTETTNQLDGILGYNHSTGVLEFSTLIDGGTY